MPGIHNGIGTTFRSTAFGGGAPSSPDFVIQVDTTQAGSASDTIILPLKSGGTYDGTIDWGDSSTSPLSYANRSHTYAAGGTYTITISGSRLAGWAYENAGDKLKIIDISNWGVFEFSDRRAFQGCSNMDVTATDVPTITATDFTSNFYGCNSMTSPTDWSSWDTSTVTNFFQCFAQNSGFNAKLDGWVHSSVTRVDKMLNKATVFNQDLNTWDVSGVTNWTEFARDAYLFNGSVATWVPSGNMSSYAFLSATSFEGNGCSTWDASGVTGALSLFSNTAFSDNISGWDTSAITVMTSMLRNCDNFNRNIANWTVHQVTSFSNFMTDATGLETAIYDAVLIGWEADLQAAYPGGVGYTPTISINFGGSQFTSGGAGETAKNSLVANFGWTITDGGGI